MNIPEAKEMVFFPFVPEHIKEIGQNRPVLCQFGKSPRNAYWDVAQLVTDYTDENDPNGYYWVLDNDTEENLEDCIRWAFLPKDFNEL